MILCSSMKFYLLTSISYNIGMYTEKISESIGLGQTLVQVDQQNNFEKVFLLNSNADTVIAKFFHIYTECTILEI